MHIFSDMSGVKLKKSIGKIILKINAEILELQGEYKKQKEGGTLSKKGELLEKGVIEKKEALESALKELENREAYIVEEHLEKTVQMIKDNLNTAATVLGKTEVSLSEVQTAQKEASDTLAELEAIDQENEAAISGLINNITHLVVDDDATSDKEQFDRELEAIGKYQRDRFRRMEKTIKEKMSAHRIDLVKKWNEKKEYLDHQALKELKNDFEATHKQMNYMVSEWDKRKLSNILSDFLADLITDKFEEYWNEYKVMEEVKRNEAAALRMKNQKLEEYKREKRRDIPTWPTSLPYNKFKPDLLA